MVVGTEIAMEEVAAATASAVDRSSAELASEGIRDREMAATRDSAMTININVRF